MLKTLQLFYLRNGSHLVHGHVRSVSFFAISTLLLLVTAASAVVSILSEVKGSDVVKTSDVGSNSINSIWLGTIIFIWYVFISFYVHAFHLSARIRRNLNFLFNYEVRFFFFILLAFSFILFGLLYSFLLSLAGSFSLDFFFFSALFSIFLTVFVVSDTSCILSCSFGFTNENTFMVPAQYIDVHLWR